jgi:hypothetical protein
MNSLPWIVDIKSRAGGKPVVLVEGQDDVVLLGHFFSQRAPDWVQRLHLAEARGKKRVVQGITVHCPDWIGIIDWDEWASLDVQDALKKTDRLKVLPRFCIESYFCVPEELWEALPLPQRQRVGDDITKLSRLILSALPDWVAHGAMWRVLRARRRGLFSGLGFPAELENRPVTDEAEIRAILQTWYDYLKPDDILNAYRAELQAARVNHSEEQQLKIYVHGKKFFDQVVVQHLDQLFSGKGRGDWLQRFRNGPIQPPLDLVDLLDEVLSLIQFQQIQN